MPSVGKYEILGTLGTGSMGTVYRARDTILDREIALKTIRAGPSVDPELRERFYREARTCARLQHPNIVTVYDLGEAEGMAYIAMELLEGEDLRRIIETRRSFPLETRLELMIQICAALGHAHRNDVIHRDVKPSNVFILKENRAKVLDFGIARLPSSKLTLIGKVLGTPNYMAPEQILGQGCDGRSDLFAAAVVFFEFITGVHPFHGLFIPRRIASGPPDSLREVDPELPRSLEIVLSRAMEKEPELRYQTGEQFGKDLKKALAELRGPQALSATDPSLRPFAAPEARNPAANGAAEVQPAADNAEKRLSEFLRLLHDFDSAAERKAVHAAYTAFAEMKKLAAADERFAGTIAEYEKRLGNMGPVPGAPPESGQAQDSPTALPDFAARAQTSPSRPSITIPPAVTTPGPHFTTPPPLTAVPDPEATEVMSVPTSFYRRPTAPPLDPAPAKPATTTPAAGTASPPKVAETAAPPIVTTAQPDVKNEAAPTEMLDRTVLFDAKTGQPIANQPSKPESPSTTKPPHPPANLDKTQILRPEDALPRTPTGAHRRPLTPRPDPTRDPPPSQVTTPARKFTAEQKVIILVVVFAGILVAAAAIFLFSGRTTRPQSSVGTADVLTAEANIVAQPSDDTKTLLTVHRGDRLNVLGVPAAPRAEWVPVQSVSENSVSPPGYSRSAELGNWSTLTLALAFPPADTAGADERTGYIAGLERRIAQESGSPAARRAYLEIARQEIALARAAQQSRKPPDEALDRATRALNSAGGEPGAEELRVQMNALRQSPANKPVTGQSGTPAGSGPSAGTPANPAPYDPKADFRRAQEDWQEGRYENAERRLRRVLRVEPQNEEAARLLQLVQKAQAVDPGVRQ
jgi:serine/threonine-protein kinase